MFVLLLMIIGALVMEYAFKAVDTVVRMGCFLIEKVFK